MAAVDFLHQENPPAWAGLEPITLGTEGQRQTNYATQPVLALRGPYIKIPSGPWPFFRYRCLVSGTVVAHVEAPVAWGRRTSDTAVATPLLMNN
ncbi:hypothetical protein TNCV_3997891 [Trichonephila clavipes]|nr:hypothetical protein TNCV_3997891 [Trichonephila clavipes]